MRQLEEYEWGADYGSLSYESETGLSLTTDVVDQPLAKHVPSDYSALRSKYWAELKHWLATQA